jgi:hypothetical protein
MAQAIGDHQGDDRTRDQRQRNAGGDEGKINLEGHGGHSRLDETIMQLCTITPLVEAALFPLS